MEAEVFIKEANRGKTDFKDVAIEGVVDLEKIDHGPDICLKVKSITVLDHVKTRHVKVSSPLLRVLSKSKIGL